MKSTLLLSFVDKENLYDAISKISELLNIQKNKIFVFKIEEISQYVLTFNLPAEKSNIQFNSIWPNTISVHRKKQTNTLYSLNAMNELIKKENGGVFKRDHILNWEKLRNKLLIIKNGKLNLFNLQLIRINQ